MCDGCHERIVSYTCSSCRKRHYCSKEECLRVAWPAHRLECSGCEQEAAGDVEFAAALETLGLPFRCVVRRRVGADLHYQVARDVVGVTLRGKPALVKFETTEAEVAHHIALAASHPARVPLVYGHKQGALVMQWLTCCLHDSLNLVRTASELAHILRETVDFIRELAALGLRHGMLDTRSIFIDEGRVVFTNFTRVGLLTPPNIAASGPPTLRTANDEIIAFFAHMASALSAWVRARLPLQLQLPGQDEGRILSYLCSLVKLDAEVSEALCPETYIAKRERPTEEEPQRKRQRFQRAAAAMATSPPTIKS